MLMMQSAVVKRKHEEAELIGGPDGVEIETPKASKGQV